MTLSPTDAAILIAAAAGAGAMNALAGGGTLLTFPTLLLLGIPGITANATSTVALLPGAAASLAGYRREVAPLRRWLRALLVPSLVGGAAGSLLLLATPEKLFEALAPWLVLFATVLFAVQWIRTARARSHAGPESASAADPVAAVPAGAFAAQLAISVYGGYFGAGIGILMLVVLQALGHRDIHGMNGLKNFFGMCINGVASAVFVVSGRVDWGLALLMAAGAIAGGFAGASFGRFLGQTRARAAVVILGVAAAVLLFVQRR